MWHESFHGCYFYNSRSLLQMSRLLRLLKTARVDEDPQALTARNAEQRNTLLPVLNLIQQGSTHPLQLFRHWWVQCSTVLRQRSLVIQPSCIPETDWFRLCNQTALLWMWRLQMYACFQSLNTWPCTQQGIILEFSRIHRQSLMNLLMEITDCERN